MTSSAPGEASAAHREARTAETALHGHVGFVIATLFSHDGARLYSGSADGAVRVHDVETGALVSTFAAHRAPIAALRLSGDGSRLYTASLDGTAAARSPRDGGLRRRLTGHRGGVHALAVSATRVATGGYDGTIRTWDVDGAGDVARDRDAAPAVIAAHAHAVTDLAFASGERLLSASRDCTVRAWDLATGECVQVLDGHEHRVTRLAVSDERRTVLSEGEDGQCVRGDLSAGVPAWAAGTGGMPAYGLALAPDGTYALSGGAEPIVRCDVASGAQRALDDRTASCRVIALSPDGALAALGGDDLSILLCDLACDRVRRTLPGASGGHIVAAVGSAGDVVATGHRDGSLTLHAHRPGRGRDPRRGRVIVGQAVMAARWSGHEPWREDAVAIRRVLPAAAVPA